MCVPGPSLNGEAEICQVAYFFCGASDSALAALSSQSSYLTYISYICQDDTPQVEKAAWPRLRVFVIQFIVTTLVTFIAHYIRVSCKSIDRINTAVYNLTRTDFYDSAETFVCGYIISSVNYIL